MFSDIIEVSVTYGQKLSFFLRMIGIAAENELRQKTFGLTEAQAAEQEYAANVQILVDLSEKMPTGLFPNKPPQMSKDEQAKSPQTYIEDFATPKEAIEKFFAEKSVVKERIAFYAVRGYFVRLQPTDFF